MALIIEKLGQMTYEDALALQLKTLMDRASGELTDDVLLLLQHNAVFTLGRGASKSSLPSHSNTPVVESERGGDITWHGPGQLVGYWIRKLEGNERDLHRHLRLIEERIIDALSVFDLTGTQVQGLTGVWVNDKKIASIGVAVRRWVTYHGFSLNINVDRTIYDSFRPCGLDGARMTDLSDLTGRVVTFESVRDAVADSFLAQH